MAREFGKLHSRLLHNHRFLALETDTARLSYAVLIASEHGNSIGCFRFPLTYLADAMYQDEAASRASLDDLIRVGLIDYDFNRKIIRIRKFLKHSPITNAKHMIGAVRHLLTIPEDTAFYAEVASELMINGFEKYVHFLNQSSRSGRSSATRDQERAASYDATAESILTAMTECRRGISRGRLADIGQEILNSKAENAVALCRALCIDLSNDGSAQSLSDITQNSPIDTPIDSPMHTQRQRQIQRQRPENDETLHVEDDTQEKITDLNRKLREQGASR